MYNNKIGILIPTYNREGYLDLSLESARVQAHENLEIIVIDNGSTDGTAKYMATLSDPRVSYIVNDHNLGMIGSINKGINLFSDNVEWCTILSDDDLFDNNCISRLLETAHSVSAKSIVHSHRIFIDSRGNRIREASIAPREESAFDFLSLRARFTRETYLSGVLFNRKAFLEINGYPAFKTGVASDDAFIFALSLKDRLVFDQQALTFIRMHEEAESASSADAMLKLQTIGQFETYCRKAVNDTRGYSPLQRAAFEASLSDYAKGLKSYWWTQAAQSLESRKDQEKDELFELLSMVDRNAGNYSFRVRIAVFFYKLTGIFLEHSEGYRKCWKRYIAFFSFLMKTVNRPASK